MNENEHLPLWFLSEREALVKRVRQILAQTIWINIGLWVVFLTVFSIFF